MPLIVILLWIARAVGSDRFLVVKFLGSSSFFESFNLGWFFLVLGFLVKLPVFLFHR